MTRLWSEDYVSESDEESYGPRPSNSTGKRAVAPDPILGEMGSMAVLAEGARSIWAGNKTTSKKQTSSGDAPEATSWIPECCSRNNNVDATRSAAVRSVDSTDSTPTWGSYTTTGDQTQKQAAAFAASVEQASREAPADAPLLGEDTRLSDDTDGDEDASVEMTEEGYHDDAPLDEEIPGKRKKSGRTRRGFGLLIAGMFPPQDAIGQTKSMLDRDLSADEEDNEVSDETRDLDLQDPKDPPAAVASVPSEQWVEKAANENSPEDEIINDRELDPVEMQQRSFSPDLIPIGGEKDLESAAGSTKGSAEEDSSSAEASITEGDSNKNVEVLERSPRRSLCYSCCLILGLLLLAGLGAFFATGYTVPGFLKRNSKTVGSVENQSVETPWETSTSGSVSTPGTGTSGSLSSGSGTAAGGGSTPDTQQTTGTGEFFPPMAEVPNPSAAETSGPTSEPTEETSRENGITLEAPTASPSAASSTVTTELKFAAVANIPFDANKATELEQLLLVSDADFLLHVGNIRDGSNADCQTEDYDKVAAILASSSVPVWVLPGPNDWSVCDDIAQAQTVYEDRFFSFTSENWGVLPTYRQPGRPYNFAWEANENVLVIGLDLLSADVPGTIDEVFAWTKAVSLNFGGEQIVIASHSIPFEFMSRVDTLGLSNVLYVRGSEGPTTPGNRVMRATARLSYAIV